MVICKLCGKNVEEKGIRGLDYLRVLLYNSKEGKESVVTYDTPYNYCSAACLICDLAYQIKESENSFKKGE